MGDTLKEKSEQMNYETKLSQSASTQVHRTVQHEQFQHVWHVYDALIYNSQTTNAHTGKEETAECG